MEAVYFFGLMNAMYDVNYREILSRHMLEYIIYAKRCCGLETVFFDKYAWVKLPFIISDT
jgi:hypothetical protein